MTFDEIFTTVSGLAVQNRGAFASMDDIRADLHITGSDGGVIGAAVTDGEPMVRKGTIGTPEVTVSVSASDFAALLSGKLNPMVAFMTGRIKATGNYARIMGMMKGFRR